MKVDLYLHSCFSDGKLNYNELNKLMRLNRVEYFSITDHDIYDNELNAFFLSKEKNLIWE